MVRKRYAPPFWLPHLALAIGLGGSDSNSLSGGSRGDKSGSCGRRPRLATYLAFRHLVSGMRALTDDETRREALPFRA